MVRIIQFVHSGREHTLSPTEKKNGIKEWNCGSHRRKFMLAQGQYVQGNSTLSPVQDILFWGEWEPTSEVKRLQIPAGGDRVPKWLHKPFLRIGKGGNVILPKPTLTSNTSKTCSCTQKHTCAPTHSHKCCPSNGINQDTDPFVFGDEFLYSNCRQTNLTVMRNLAKGTIILFGSYVLSGPSAPYFELDTVFVVGENRSYTPKTVKKDLSGFVPPQYLPIMGYGRQNTSPQFTCYKGASFNNHVNGMYSFVPCKPCGGPVAGFQKPKLTSATLSLIAKNLLSVKYTNSTLQQNKVVWNKIRNIINQQGFYEGVNLQYQLHQY